jgi:hypothetical protein
LVLVEVVELVRLLETMAAIAVLAICRYLLRPVAVAVVAEMVRHCPAVLEAAGVALVDLPDKLLALEQAAKETTVDLLVQMRRHIAVLVAAVPRRLVPMEMLVLVLVVMDTHLVTETHSPEAVVVGQLQVVELHQVDQGVAETVAVVPRRLEAMVAHTVLVDKP